MLFAGIELVLWLRRDVLEMFWVLAHLFISFFDICISIRSELESSSPGSKKSGRDSNCVDFDLCQYFY